MVSVTFDMFSVDAVYPILAYCLIFSSESFTLPNAPFSSCSQESVLLVYSFCVPLNGRRVDMKCPFHCMQEKGILLYTCSKLIKWKFILEKRFPGL